MSETQSPKASPLCECGHEIGRHGVFGCFHRASGERAAPFTSICNCTEYRPSVSGETAAPATNQVTACTCMYVGGTAREFCPMHGNRPAVTISVGSSAVPATPTPKFTLAEAEEVRTAARNLRLVAQNADPNNPMDRMAAISIVNRAARLDGIADKMCPLSQGATS